MSFTYKNSGIALVTVLVISIGILGVVLGISSILALGAKRATADQSLSLKAQYGAESALSLAQARIQEAYSLMNNELEFLPTLQIYNVINYIISFCGHSNVQNPPEDISTWTEEQRNKGYLMCQADPVSVNDSNRFKILNDTIAQDVYSHLGISNASDYWQTTFNAQTISLNPDSDQALSMKLGLSPKEVKQMQDGSYRFYFRQDAIEATSNLLANGKIVASRKLRLSNSEGEFYLAIGRPSFSSYAYFVDNRSLLDGTPLYFPDGERFEGRVHVNKGALFYSSDPTRGLTF
ncbi:MAG: DUF4900 domain-containing protein [Deinococcales bacterium]